MTRSSPIVSLIVKCGLLALTVVAAAAPGLGAETSDIVIADFEGATYGDWRVEGEAFGKGPARGTLPRQMRVSGFLGKGLVNSFFGGDRSTGRLTSPPFAIQRDYIKFLVGGGGHAGKTCVNLIVAGRVARTATGPNTQPGGSERLDWECWDVRELKGQQAVIEIVDQASGGWGHINVDQIVQSDRPPEPRPRLEPPARPGEPPRLVHPQQIKITGRYLVFPVSNNQPQRGRMTVVVGDQLVHNLDCDFPPDREAIDWWSYLDMSEYVGRTAKVVAQASAEVRKLIRSSDEIPHLQPLYDEPLRPQLRFSQMRGWNNDPNGMVYYDGLYHLFWQCNPAGRKWANMYWGHATSRDMIHWREQPRALRPFGDGVNNRHRSMAVKNCFSGSGHVDVRNTGGWQTGPDKTIVLAFTDTGCGESLAYSTDGGRTFTYYAGNPVIRHSGRDPNLTWYEPGQHWVIAVFDQDPELGRNIAFYTSKDLKHWELASKLPGYFECPELFQLPVDGDPARKKWVVFAANAEYAIGEFDGKRFTPDHEGKHRLHWGAYYASQCFSNPPDGRVVQIGWARVDIPDMPFNQTFTVPANLTLRTTGDGVRMFAEPIRELERLRKANPQTAESVALEPGGAPARFAVRGQLLDIEVVLKGSPNARAVLAFGENTATYDFSAQRLDEMPLRAEGGRVRLRLLIDRPLYELFGGSGACHKTAARKDMGRPLGEVSLSAEGGPVAVESITIYALRSIWR